MIEQIKYKIKEFLNESDKSTLLFALIIINPVMGFTPNFPGALFYIAFVLYAIYALNGKQIFNRWLVALLIYIPIEILIVSPNALFKAWQRYALFALLLACVSPLFDGEELRRRRAILFRIILYFCAFIGVGSFFARYLGINYMRASLEDIVNGAGLFSGLTTHSMLLGPIAGIGTIFLVFQAYTQKKKVLWGAAGLCMISVLFSASRSALMATLTGVIIMLYKASGSANRFARVGIVTVLLLNISYPLWQGFTASVKQKNQTNLNAGSATASRDEKWDTRIAEFKSSPVLGVGFVSAKSVNELNDGVLETGTSWLSILSMLGIIGFILIIGLLLPTYIALWNNCIGTNPIVIGVLSLFFVNMIAEGYIFFGGSFLAFCLWLTIGVASDSKYYPTI